MGKNNHAQHARTTKGGKMKVVVGIPSLDFCPTDFAMSLGMMVYYSSVAYHLALINQKGAPIDMNRRTIVDIAQNMGAEWLLFLDSDMTFPPDTLERLISHGKAVVGTNYSTRYENNPFKCTAIQLPGGKSLASDKEELIQVAGMGCGCLLIHMDVFRKISKPYFLYTGHGPTFVSEDFYFFNAINKAGISAFCDLTLSKEIGHMGMKSYMLRTT